MTGPAKGRFITLEGGEGAGKSVQAKRLEERLAALGLDVVRTREPGGSPGAEALREAILSGFAAEFGPAAQALMFAAARVDHLEKTILPGAGERRLGRFRPVRRIRPAPIKARRGTCRRTSSPASSA